MAYWEEVHPNHMRVGGSIYMAVETDDPLTAANAYRERYGQWPEHVEGKKQLWVMLGECTHCRLPVWHMEFNRGASYDPERKEYTHDACKGAG